MIEKFLKTKHWKIFLLMYGIPIGLQMTMIGMAISGYDGPSTFLAFPFIMIISIGTLFTLFWSIGVGLNNSLPENSNLNLKKFKIIFFFPLIYLSLFLLFMIISMTANEWLNELSFGSRLKGLGIGIVLILHLFSMYCMLYMLYFCSKTIKSIELNREAQSSEYMIEFMFLWFFIFGVWVLQPRLNELAEKHYSQQRI